MNWKRLTVTVAFTVVVLIGIIGCPGAKPPETPAAPQGPGTTYQRAPTPFEVTTTQPQEKSIRYVMDWGDGNIDTTIGSYESGNTATIHHTWVNDGDYSVKALAILDEDETKASVWSEPTSIKVLPNASPDPPTIQVPLAGVKDAWTYFSATTTDQDGDSVGFKFEFKKGTTGDWTDEAIGFVPSGSTVPDSNKYTKIEAVYVKCKARDIHKSESDWCDSVSLLIGKEGAVMWWWWTQNEDEAAPMTGPVIALDGTRELAYAGFEDEGYKFYGIEVTTGNRKRTGSTVSVPEDEFEFTGHPAYCEQTGHIIFGKEDGELYAFTTSLSRVWHWPGANSELEMTMTPWGTPAINGNKIYVSREDTIIRGHDTLDVTKLYLIEDNGDTPSTPIYYSLGEVELLGAPVIDNDGNVLVVTDSGYLYKMPLDLSTVTWRVLLSGGNEVFGPVIGGGGTIYCGSNGKLFAINPDGTEKWQITLGVEPQIVVSPSVVFVTAIVLGQGTKLFSIDPATGNQNWSVDITSTCTTPVLTANGLMYCQDDNDILFCRHQSDGAEVWHCDCPQSLSHGGKGYRKLDIIQKSPSITSTGNIIVAGDDALYCVAGYKEGLLMDAPWPKWQKDTYNTGKAVAW